MFMFIITMLTYFVYYYYMLSLFALFEDERFRLRGGVARPIFDSEYRRSKQSTVNVDLRTDLRS